MRGPTKRHVIHFLDMILYSSYRAGPEDAWTCLLQPHTTLEPLFGHTLYKMELKLTIFEKDSRERHTTNANFARDDDYAMSVVLFLD